MLPKPRPDTTHIRDRYTDAPRYHPNPVPLEGEKSVHLARDEKEERKEKEPQQS
jgi:hypothetical protein